MSVTLNCFLYCFGGKKTQDIDFTYESSLTLRVTEHALQYNTTVLHFITWSNPHYHTALPRKVKNKKIQKWMYSVNLCTFKTVMFINLLGLPIW